MKFNIIFSTKKDQFNRDVEGDLDAAKSYIKLAAGDDYAWGAIQRIDDDLVPGDVERWIVQKNRTTKQLLVSPFSFFEVDPEININAMRAAFEQYPQMQEMNKLLGGGVL